MKLLSVNIKGFKQFSDAAFDFNSQNSSSPFGLLVGFNGAGKTTFLSALYFAFHGDVLESLDAPEHLCNDEVFAALDEGEDGHISVAVDFILKDIKYSLIRNRTIRRIAGSEVQIEEAVQVFNHGENLYETPPQVWLNRAFPANLAKFLFFPGEHLTDFFDPAKFSGFVEDIRTLSGLDKLALLKEAIAGTITRIDRRIKSIPGDDKNQALIEQIQGVESKLQEQSTHVLNLTNDLVTSESRQAELKKLLASKTSEFEAIRNLEVLRNQLPNLENEVRTKAQAVTDLYTRHGWALLASTKRNQLIEKLAKFQHAGHLNRDWPAASIKRLLAGGQCICGGELEPGSIQESRIISLANQDSALESPTPYFELEDAVAQGGALDSRHLSNLLKQAWAEVKAAEAKLQLNLGAINDLISKQTSSEPEQVMQLHFRELVSLDETLPSLRITKAEEASKLLALQNDLVRLQGELSDNLGAVTEHGALARRREALLRISLSIDADARALESHIRSELKNFLQDNLGPVFFGAPFDVHVGESFDVKVTQGQQSQGMAAGQTKALAFAIIAALTRIAGSIANRFGLSENLHGEQYPLVIDAGFAELTDYFSAYPIQWLKEASSQVVLISLPEISSRLIDLIPDNERAFLYILVNNQKAKGQTDQFWTYKKAQYPVLQFGQNTNATTILKVE
jgi:DNA repair exonuclease SbcCD ATPase subunit